MYFKNFPQIYYNFDKLGIRVMRDITANVRPVARILENALYYDYYDIADDETPEIVAEKLYGSPTLHWILMLVNERYDLMEDWPIPEWKMDDYIDAKYGPGQQNEIHKIYGRDHYVSPTGRIVNSDAELATPVTNSEYERALNEKKRKIKIVQPDLIDIFIKDLEEVFPSE